jgi:ribosomal protein S18 acetylase RimI-like enzyme
MAYVKESIGDRNRHRPYHDRMVNGVPARSTAREKVIWRNIGSRIVVVTPHSPKPQRVLARLVGQVANRELHSDGGLYYENEPSDDRDMHLFIYCVHDRAVGLVILEKRDHVCQYSWAEWDAKVQKSLPKVPVPIWSLGIAWTHKKHRRRGLARTLFREACAFLETELDAVGVYTPLSPEGEVFARSIFPQIFLIAK